jgi:hypothetical protein
MMCGRFRLPAPAYRRTNPCSVVALPAAGGRLRPPAGPAGAAEDDQAVIVAATWSYLGQGYQTTGEAWLAASAAARAREERRIAKEELRTLQRTA